MNRRLLLLGLVVAGTAAVLLLVPVLMHPHHHHPTHQLHLRKMADGAQYHYESERAGPDGLPLPADLPPSVGPTPTGSLCNDAPPPVDPGWHALQYEPPASMRSTYTRLSDRAFVVRVNGDLDCDGVESTFERRCERSADGFDCAAFETNPTE